VTREKHSRQVLFLSSDNYAAGIADPMGGLSFRLRSRGGAATGTITNIVANEFLGPASQFRNLHLDLIIHCMLKTPKQRMQHMFLKRRPDGRYVF
jgi:hypothetical protein